jgi:hypothetical protein
MQGGRGAYTVSVPTAAGSDFLHARGQWAPRRDAGAARAGAGDGAPGRDAAPSAPRLLLRLPASMEQEDAAAAAARAAEAERAHARAEARAAAGAAEQEREQLVRSLHGRVGRWAACSGCLRPRPAQPLTRPCP